MVFSERGAGKHATRIQAVNEAAVACSVNHRNVVSGAMVRTYLLKASMLMHLSYDAR